MREITINKTYYLYESSSDIFVVVVHGMVETMDGYLNLKDFLVENGVNVVLYNQLGHGFDAERLGHLNDNDSLLMIDNVIEIDEYLKSELNASKVVIVAHSMGTSVVRAAMNKHDFDKVVLNGMPEDLKKASNKFARLVFGRILDKNKETKLFDKLTFDKYKKKVGIEHSWVCRNKEYMKFYKSDSYTGYIGTGNFYKELINIFTLATPKNVNPTPMLLTSGKGDPVTAFGRLCYKEQTKFRELGCDVEVILYEGMNHFIYGEENREKCFEDLLKYIKE